MERPRPPVRLDQDRRRDQQPRETLTQHEENLRYATPGLLAAITAGTPKEPGGVSAVVRPRPLKPALRPQSASTPDGRLRGRRVLVLGGPHHAAAAVRERIIAAGGAAAVNLTTQVSDVVLLDGGTRDRRWSRAETRRLRVLEHESLEPACAPRPPAESAQAPNRTPVDADQGVVLPRGGVVDLPEGQEWQLAVRWPELAEPVDVVAFVADAEEQVATDDDFVFYNAPTHPTGCVDLALYVPGECVATINTGTLPDHATRVLLAAAVADGATFAAVGPVEVVLRGALGSVIARATLDAATTEATLVLADVYVRNGTWRFRAVGQGHDHALSALAVAHGVDIED